MKNEKSVRIELVIAAALIAVTACVFSVYYAKAKKNIDNFNDVLGKTERAGFSDVVQVILNDNKYGTTDENIRYNALQPGKVVEIKETMFATQVNDVYINAEDYLGKTIKLEGIFKTEQYYEADESYCFVVRFGPGGCCGIDANVGFEVKWSDQDFQAYPENESWVEASGELKVDENEYFLYLELASLTVLDKRGAEFVSR